MNEELPTLNLPKDFNGKDDDKSTAGYKFIIDQDIKENLKKLDYGAIEFIEKMDADGFLRYVSQRGATICGYLPIAVLIKALGKGTVSLLKYYTSGDVIGDFNSSVSYASMVIR